jgi:probable HAF family extracellular repeat protein
MIRFSFSNQRSYAASLTLAVCLTLPLSLTTAGCGGGSGNAASPIQNSPVVQGQGRASFAVRWPERDGRLVPVLANSIVIVVRNTEGKTVGTTTLNRPDGTGAAFSNTATIDPLPTGTLIATATAYPERDGAGVAQAAAAAPLAITANSNTEIHLVLQSTIDHLDVTTASANASVGVAYSVPITTTARDAEGNIVLTLPSKLHYALSDPKMARIDTATGVLTGNTVGTAQVTVTDEESGKSATTTIKVTRSAAYRLNWIPSLPGLPNIYPKAVNGKGGVIGYCTAVFSTTSTGFYWQPNADGSGGQMTAISPPAGDSAVRIFSINDRGQVVGLTEDINARRRAILWENGKLTILPAPFPGQNYLAYDINAFGDIIGTTELLLTNGVNVTRACIWRNGTPTVIDLPTTANQQTKAQGSVLDVTAINDNGFFVGNLSENDVIYTTLWSPNNTFTKMLSTVAKFANPSVQDINNSGKMTGTYYTTVEGKSARRGYVLDNGRLTDIAPVYSPAYLPVFISGISSDGTVAGSCSGPGGGEPIAFRWRYGVSEDLNKLLPANTPTTSLLIQGEASSGPGHIAGIGRNGNTTQGFLLTPQGGTGNANVGVN